MKIIYGVTVIKSESFVKFNSNVELLKSININLMVVLNTNHEDTTAYYDKRINDIGGMRKSREALLNEMSNYDADAYMVFDSDIILDNEFVANLQKIMKYKKNYDFISLYYKGDPPIPAFFTLASSLNDFYNQKNNHKVFDIEIPFFDDTKINASEYQKFNVKKSNKVLSDILYGRSYARDIPEFTNQIDETDTTTGGTTIYFNKRCLNASYDWKSINGKSLTWYDSYRTFMMTKEFRFCKVPFFLEHRRHSESIELSYDSIERYIMGLELYMNSRDDSWSLEAFVLHVLEMYMYIKGMLRKINLINLSNTDKDVIQQIDDFINVENKDFVKKLRRLLWK